jgi:hypothetical protein
MLRKPDLSHAELHRMRSQIGGVSHGVTAKPRVHVIIGGQTHSAILAERSATGKGAIPGPAEVWRADCDA